MGATSQEGEDAVAAREGVEVMLGSRVMGHGTHARTQISGMHVSPLVRCESRHTYGWVMAHVWMSRGTHMNESCHIYEWVMAHVWMSHGTYKRVMAHILMSHGTHISGTQVAPLGCYESWHTYEWVMAHVYMSQSHGTPMWVGHGTHIWISHGTRINESGSRNTYVSGSWQHMWMSHGTRINESESWNTNVSGS